MRICPLLPSATEIVAKLGLVDSFVGVSEECDWPLEVRDLPVVTASRVDTTKLSSLEIERTVRQEVSDGRPLYAIDADLLERTVDPMAASENLEIAVLQRAVRRVLGLESPLLDEMIGD